MKVENYPKVLRRLSTFFQVAGILLIIGAGVQVCHLVTIITTTKTGDPATRPAETFVLAVSFFAVSYALDYLIILGDQLTYIEQVQQQQNKVLSELRRLSKESDTQPG
ncbi:MAG TPA: hypothetical protein VLK33_23015 [Terriglobales bacterium]|nr:hypothetical protein [Terriglobales bacterium]